MVEDIVEKKPKCADLLREIYQKHSREKENE